MMVTSSWAQKMCQNHRVLINIESPSNSRRKSSFESLTFKTIYFKSSKFKLVRDFEDGKDMSQQYPVVDGQSHCSSQSSSNRDLSSFEPQTS